MCRPSLKSGVATWFASIKEMSAVSLLGGCHQKHHVEQCRTNRKTRGGNSDNLGHVQFSPEGL